MNLNFLCNYFYKNKLEPSENLVKNLLQKNGVYDENNMYKLTLTVLVTINEILQVIFLFLNDYNILISHTNKDEEYYLLSPINYLMFIKGYDGVYNVNDDTGRTGSVKYIFDGSYGARGYRPEFKRRETLKGSLIFMHY